MFQKSLVTAITMFFFLCSTSKASDSFLLDTGNKAFGRYDLYYNDKLLTDARLEKIIAVKDALYVEMKIFRHDDDKKGNAFPFAHLRISIDSYSKTLVLPNFDFSEASIGSNFNREAESLFSVRIASGSNKIPINKMSRTMMRASALLNHPNIEKEMRHDGCFNRNTFKASFKFIETYINLNKQRSVELIINNNSLLYKSYKNAIEILTKYTGEDCSGLVTAPDGISVQQIEENIREAKEIHARYLSRAYNQLSKNEPPVSSRCNKVKTLYDLLSPSSQNQSDAFHMRMALNNQLLKEADVRTLHSRCTKTSIKH